MAIVLKTTDPYYSMDPVKALEEIEAGWTMLQKPGQAWLKERLDAVRAAMITPELRKAIYEVVADLMDHEPWDPPFNELQDPPHRD